MKLQSWLGAWIAGATLFVSIQGCTSGTDAAAPGGTHCTPGAYVFCRCQDRAEGTKLCNDDGASFQECSTGAAGECKGGEDTTDPDTGKQVDPPMQQQDTTTTTTSPDDTTVESCPGKATAITPGAELVIQGDTTAAKSDLKGKAGACASGDGGADHVYHLQPTGTGSLSIKLQGDLNLNPLFYVRSTCADESTQIACAPPLGVSKLVQLSVNVVSGHDYYVVVDGASATAGKYKLTTLLTTGTFCGDGKVDVGEACDDGNKTEADGCSNSCQNVDGDPATGGSCNGQTVHVWPGKVVTGAGSTLPYGNTFTRTTGSCVVGPDNLNIGQDHLYAVTAHAAGNLKVTLTPGETTYNAMLVARATCADPTSQGAGMCANNGSAGVAETMTFPVTNNQTVYVAAEGVGSAKGTFSIRFELP